MIRTTRATRWAALTGAGLIAATSLFLAPAAASASTTSDGSGETRACDFGARLVSLWTALPEDLQADLKDLRDLPEGERGEAARDIREAARDGEYGDAVQRHAWRVRDRRIFLWSTMPEQLQADLTEIRDAEPAERRELASEVGQNALDGVYGERAQVIAERIQEHCAAG